MTTCVTVTDLRLYLPQVPTSQDTLLQAVLDRAGAMVDGETGLAFADWAAAGTARDFYISRATDRLYVPACKPASLSAIATLEGKATGSETTTAITDYAELEDALPLGGPLFRLVGWPAGWYRATAIWGYGPAPDDIKQVVIEKAVNLFLGAQGGQFSDVVGIEGGGAVGYNRAWTNAQRAVIATVRVRYGQYGFA